MTPTSAEQLAAQLEHPTADAIWNRALEVFGDEAKARSWMKTPRDLFAGRTPEDVATELKARLQNMITAEPIVTVSIARSAPVRVNVVGEVRTPGIYELGRDRTVTAALAAAGWITDFAGKDRIFVVRRGDAQTRIRFRTRELTGPEPRTAGFRLRDGDVVVVE